MDRGCCVAGCGAVEGARVARSEVGHGRLHLEDDGTIASFDIDDPHELGKMGEEIATRYLEACGCSVVARNWRCHFGEVDVIVRSDDETILVEVKTRRNAQAAPELAVDRHKRERYRRLSLCYLNEHPEVVALRFDIVAVTVSDRTNAHIRHLMGTCSWDS